MIDVDPKFYFVSHFCISLLRNQGRTKGEGWSTAILLKPTSNFNVGRPKAALLVILDEVCRYLSFFSLYLNIKIGKIDVNSNSL